MSTDQLEQIKALNRWLAIGKKLHADLFPDYETKVSLLNKQHDSLSEDERITLNLWYYEGEQEHLEWLHELKPSLRGVYIENNYYWRDFEKLTEEEYTPIAWKEQLKTLELIIGNLETISSENVTMINYDFSEDKIIVGEHSIKIPPATNQAYLCRVIFKNKYNMKKEWKPLDVMAEKNWDIPEADLDESNGQEAVSAAYEVKDKIKAQSNIEDLIVAGKRTIKINPKYVQ